MSDTSNLYNDMRNLIHFLPFICSGYPWRAIGNTLAVLQHRKYPIIHSLRSENVATDSKNKETIASLFFSRCQRSKVIFRVTQKALRDFLNYYRKNLALRGSDHAKHKSGVPWIYPPLENTLTLVAYFKVTLQPFRFSPDGRKTVGLSCTLRYREVHNLKYNGYGE